MKHTTNVKTKYGVFSNTPYTEWEALKPFWADIIGSIIEVLLEHPFTLQDFRVKTGKGFIAAEYYWKKYRTRSEQSPLFEAILFIDRLKSKPKFISAIRGFNSSGNNDWLMEENFLTLARFIRSVCLPILPYLNSVQKQH